SIPTCWCFRTDTFSCRMPQLLPPRRLRVNLTRIRYKETAAAIQPGTAALFLLVRKVTADNVLEGLKGEGDTVMKTSLDTPKKRRCRRPSGGADNKGPTGKVLLSLISLPFHLCSSRMDRNANARIGSAAA